jgi:hypothetical protein
MVRSQLSMRTVEVDNIYDGYHFIGIQYGPQYRTLVQAWGGSNSTAIARLQRRGAQMGTQVHPADLDDALRLSAVASSDGRRETRLPFAVDSALLHGVTAKLWAVRRSL